MKDKYLKSIYGFTILIIVIVLQMLPAKQVQAGRQKTVRVACGMNDALYLDEKGDPQGACLYYIRQIAWNNNWNIEYVEGSYSESVEKLYNGKVDVMFPVGKDDDYKNQLSYAKFLGGYQQIGLFAREDDDIYYDDYKGFNNKKVGLSFGANSNILNAYAKKHNFSYKAVALNTIKDKVNALKNHDVDLLAFSTLNTVPGGKLVAVLDQVPFYFCTNKKNKELLKELNEGMSEAMTNTPDVVSDMYKNVLKGYNPISYTRKESRKIKSAKPVVFGVYSDCLPLAGVNSKGKCVGIYVDILKEIAAESGLKIKIKPIEDSNKLYSYMDDGTVDFVIGVQELRFHSKNAKNYLASNAITDYTTVAVTMPEYQFESAKKPIIALTKARSFLEDYIHDKYPLARIKYFNTRKQCLDAVQSGFANVTFMNTWEYNYETKNPRYQEMMEWESMRIKSVVGLGATRQSDMEILSILEKTISKIQSERVSEIISQNLNIPYESYNLRDYFYKAKNELFVGVAIFIVLASCVVIYLGIKRKYIEELIVANNTKSDFLSRMSHELRTPLNAINGYAAIASEDAQEGKEDKEKLLDNMNSIQKASDYLLGIIKDILDVQKMETGKITLELAETNPNEYMDTVVKMIQPMADDKNISFSYTMINGGDNNYIMDGLRVQQILFNILYNAVKFTPEGGSITMTSERKDMDERYVTLRFVVSDTGIGMSQEFMKNRLFQHFAQENQDITSPYAGVGNGLAICSELVRLMDGNITCESEQGKGTTFTVDIKVEYKPQQKQVKKRKKTAAKYDLKGLRVLMCEDNLMNQDMEKQILNRMNCNVDIADDGQIGVDKFGQSPEGFYDVILMDIRMPNMDGLEATKEIRSMNREDAKTIPIIAVSANAFEEDVAMSVESGMNEHLSKPVGGKKLYEAIVKYCNIL